MHISYKIHAPSLGVNGACLIENNFFPPNKVQYMQAALWDRLGSFPPIMQIILWAHNFSQPMQAVCSLTPAHV